MLRLCSLASSKLQSKPTPNGVTVTYNTEENISSNPLRIAILGTGMIGEVHRRSALLCGATLVGAMASTPERSIEMARRWHTQPILTPADLKTIAPGVSHAC